jgi:hypothetical protein
VLALVRPSPSAAELALSATGTEEDDLVISIAIEVDEVTFPAVRAD